MHRPLRISLAIVLVLACGGPDPADARLQQVVDAYALGLRLGVPVDAATRARFRLAPAPYVGYADTAYRGPSGVERLYVRVNAYVDDANPHVPAGARVTGISLEVPASAHVAAIDTQLRRLLGTPLDVCYTTPLHPTPLSARFWAVAPKRGVLLVSAPSAPVDTAVLTVGAAPLDTAHIQRQPCGATALSPNTGAV
jgi:hypothetical protein